MRTLVLYATVTTTADNVVNLIVPKTGRLKSIRWAISFDGPADNARCSLELATRQTSQFATNDVSNVISAVDLLTSLLTSGGGLSSYKDQEWLDYPIAAGERIYLHASVTGTVSAAVRVMLDIHD